MNCADEAPRASQKLEIITKTVAANDGMSGEYQPLPLEEEVPRLAGNGLGGLIGAPVMSREHHAIAVRSGTLASMHSWELVTAVDGPGTRMTIFLAGCPLRCLYCHNPDTMRMREGSAVMLADVVGRLGRYIPVFNATKGGITISGGEPLMQLAFVRNLLRAAKERSIHTALDTSGFLGARVDDSMLNDIDLVLLDVKSGIDSTYKRVTGRELAPTLAFGSRLAKADKPMWIRFVLVPGVTDSLENIRAVAGYVSKWGSVQRVEVLPFHQMGRDKWHELGMTYELEGVHPPTAQAVAAAREIFADHNLTVY